MARYDVYANPETAERVRIPYLLDIQSDHIQGVQTRVVVPLWKADQLFNPSEDLNPGFVVAGIKLAMDTPALGAVPVSILRQSVANLNDQQLLIQNALDMLLAGY